MKRAILYVHGKGGSAGEADRFRAVCPGFDVLGVDYRGELPWEAAPQIAAAYDEARRQYEHIILLANSIGAYFTMLALGDQAPDRALFVSPVLDMERLILDMMAWAGVSEQALCERGEVPTDFGETLSWAYLCYVREHPIAWQVPTEILYAGGDHLVSRQSVEQFAAEHGEKTSFIVLERGRPVACPVFCLSPYKSQIPSIFTPYCPGILSSSQAERNPTIWKSRFKTSV